MSAVSTAVIVGSISAAGSVASAKIGSSAAKNAAKTQSEAGDKALAFQKEQYGQARQDFAPYQQQGAAAVGRLGAMASQPAPAPWNQPFRPGATLADMGQPGPQMGQPGPQTPPPMRPPPQGSPVQGPALAGPPGPQGDAVAMIGPDGKPSQVPRQFVQQALAKGARLA